MLVAGWVRFSYFVRQHLLLSFVWSRFEVTGGAKHFLIVTNLRSKILSMELINLNQSLISFENNRKLNACSLFNVHPFFFYRKITWVIIIADCCSCSSFLLDFLFWRKTSEWKWFGMSHIVLTKNFNTTVDLQRNPRESNDENSAHFCFEILLISKWRGKKPNWKWKYFVIRFISFLLLLLMTRKNYYL